MTIRVGWLTSEYPKRPSRRAVWLYSGAMLTMRYRNPVLWLNRHGFHNEFYQPDKTYDAVIIIKSAFQPIVDEMVKLRRAGNSPHIIFDANVNYYYSWGDFVNPAHQPEITWQRNILQLTRMADHVIADSEYIRDAVQDINPQVTWISDNVSLFLFRACQHRATPGKLRLIWSGMADKADELVILKDVFANVDGLELWLVSNARPPMMDILKSVIPVRWFRYSDIRYAYLLGRADAIISPRHLNNSYNMGHTEYKITLGMARNLPAIVSPQPAYVTAIGYHQGGIICYTPEDWIQALQYLRDDIKARLDMGNHARETVEQHYATAVVAAKMKQLIEKVVYPERVY